MNEAPTACAHPVSGSVSLPSPGFFSPFPHGTGSLSVDHEYLALEEGPPMFRQGFSCPALLVSVLVSPMGFGIRGCHPLRRAFPGASPNSSVINGWLVRVRSPLLTESRLISVPPGTEMFQFPGFAFRSYGFRSEYPCGWVAPFRDRRIIAYLPAPRRFSQAVTSFIACGRQGIHRMRLFT